MKLYGIKIWYDGEDHVEVIIDQLFFEEEVMRDKFFDSLPFPLYNEGNNREKYDKFGYDFYTKEDYETETYGSALAKLEDIIETYEAKKKKHEKFLSCCKPHNYQLDYSRMKIISSGAISIEGV